jgi:hypothetical protein
VERVSAIAVVLLACLQVACGGGAGTNANTNTGGGGQAASATTTRVRSVPGVTTAQDIVWDAAHGSLYVSLPSTDPSTPNTIVPVNPLTGNMGTPVAAGNNPDLLSISSDFSYLWVGLDGGDAVQRFLLPGLTKDVSVPVPLDSQGNPQQPVCIQAAPVSPHSLALIPGNWNLDSPGNGIYVYDDAVQRSISVPGPSYGAPPPPGGGPQINWIQWGADDSTIYGSTGGAIATMNVTSSGVSLGSLNGGPNGPLDRPRYDAKAGLLYSTGSNYFGRTFNPVYGSMVGEFDLPQGNETACTTDSSLGRYYCVLLFYQGTDVAYFELWVFDLGSYALIDRVSFGVSAGTPLSSVTGQPLKVVRWGDAGLAVITETAPYNGNGGLFLIDGAAVNPNAAPDVATGATTWPYASMSSLAPQQTSAGSADTAVTISGNNFTPTSTVCWNCNYLQMQSLPTTYVNSQQLRITIPASLLAKAATLPLSVFDPSSNLFSTNALTFSAMPASSGTTKVTAIDLAGLAMAWDANSSLLYVGTADYDGAYPNSIVAVNTQTGSIVKSQAVSPDPDLLSISANEQYLYAAFAAATTMSQLQLPTLGSPLTWALSDPSSSLVFPAGDLKAAPQNPHTTAVTLFDQELEPEEVGGVVVYDDNVPRPSYINGWLVSGGYGLPGIYDTLAWSSSDQLLTAVCLSPGGPDEGCLSNTPLSPLYAFQVSQAGAVSISTGSPTFSQGQIHSDFGTGLIYSDDGGVANPNTQAVVGAYNASGLVAPDSSLNRVFILGQTATQANTSNFTIESFDQSAYTAVSSITLNNILGSPFELTRCGPSCLAILTFNENLIFTGNTGSLGMLYVIEDSTFVSSASVVGSHLPAPQDHLLYRWKRFSRADIARMIEAGTLRGRH